jgi:CheY-like chemotaxis protein
MAGERVLIVDDNATSLKLAAFVMRASGYEVSIVVDGASALDAIRRQHPDVVLMDIQLPGMSGLDLVRQLRADVASRGLLIIAVTAYAMKGDRERALAAGCNDYITKPIDTRTLAGAVADALLSARSGATT